jgi:hypothetical protein
VEDEIVIEDLNPKHTSLDEIGFKSMLKTQKKNEFLYNSSVDKR